MSAQVRIESVARGALKVAFWTALALIALMAVNLIGLHVLGSISSWTHWLEDHRGWLLVWRLCVYAGTIGGWLWMRERVRQREPSHESFTRLLCAEVAAILAFVAIESVLLLRA